MTPPDHDAPAVEVTVIRTGGFAGLRRQWSAQPPAQERERWIALIDRCPWDQQRQPEAEGADRFVWRIEVRLGEDGRRSEVSEAGLQGPWRELVTEVQTFARTLPGPDPA